MSKFHKAFRAIGFCGSTVALPISAAAEDAMGPPRQLLAAYNECSAAAAVQVLPISEAAVCADIFLEIKLSFLPDLDRAEFDKLAPEDRKAANDVAYAAFREWRLLSFMQN